MDQMDCFRPVVHNLFSQGPLIDFLNPSGAMQTSSTTPFMSYEYLLKFMQISCAVKHKVNIKSYWERGSLLLHYCNA